MIVAMDLLPLLGREGLVVMVTHLSAEGFLLFIWEKEGVIVAVGLLALLGREGLVVMVKHICLLRISSPLLGKRRGGGHRHTQLAAEKLPSFSWIGEV